MQVMVDDVRDFGCEVIIRTAEAAKTVLYGIRAETEILYLDHDLGDGGSGYDVVKWLIAEDILFKKIILVTSNPVGLDNMGAALVSAGYKKSLDGREFIYE